MDLLHDTSNELYFVAVTHDVYGIRSEKVYVTPHALLKEHKKDGLNVVDIIKLKRGETVCLNVRREKTIPAIVDITYEHVI